MKRSKIRQKLQDIIPISTPFTVFIEPTNICNFQCKFCPTNNAKLLRKFNIKKGLMSYELFCKTIDDLLKFPLKVKIIHFYLNGEALLNKRLIDMIKYATRNKVAERYHIKTNGSYLNPKINRELVDSGLDLIGISIEGVSSEKYKKISNVQIDYENLIKNIKDLYDHKKNCKIYVKIADSGLTDAEKTKFIKDFKNISDEIAIESLMGWSMSEVQDFTLGTKPKKSPDGLKISKREVCPFIFYTLAINFNGEVSLCCVDWSRSTVVGDLSKESLSEIWNGEKLFQFRKMHLMLEKNKNQACNNCQYISTAMDSIDKYREKILSNLEKSRI